MEDIINLIVEIAKKLRRQGVPVGISEILDSITIIENYKLLQNDRISEEELKEIMRSIFIKRDVFNEVFDDTWRKVLANRNKSKNIADLHKQVERSLNYLGLRYNQRIRSFKKIASGSRKRKHYTKELIATLNQLGFIRKNRKGYRVVNKHEAEQIIREIAEKGYTSLRDAHNDLAMRKLVENHRIDIRKNPYQYVYADFTEKNLDKIETSKLLELGIQAYKSHQYHLARKIANTVINRADLPQKIDKRGFEFLKNLTSLPNNVLYSILSSNPRLIESLLNDRKNRIKLKDLITNIEKYNPERLGEILSRIIKIKGYNLKNELSQLLQELPLQYLSAIPRSFIRKLDNDLRIELEYSIQLGEAYKSLVRALTTGDEAYFDYAESLITKALKFKEINKLSSKQYLSEKEKELYNLFWITRKILREPHHIDGIEEFLRKMNFETAWRILANLYQNTSNTKIRRKILNITLRLWQKETCFMKTKIVRGKEKRKASHGIMNVRLTLNNIVRLQEKPIVYNVPRRIKSTQLVVDISGSMRKYSLWVLLTASAFSRYIHRVILFNDRTYIIERRHITKLIDLLLGSEFKGLTNIVKALREASKDSHVKRIILLSDLKQTIRDDDPSEYLISLHKKGWKIAVILPPDHNVRAYTRLNENGIPVYVISRPERASRIFYRAWRSL